MQPDYAFEPLHLTALDVAVTQVTTSENGLAIDFPAFGGVPAMRVSYPQRRRRLFTPRDLQMARSLWELGQRVIEDRCKFESGVRAERARVARDLHDDIGGRLLTLTHRSKEPAIAELARETLRELRSVVTDLHAGPCALVDAVADWQVEAEERCGAADVLLHWQDAVGDALLTPRETEVLSLIAKGYTVARVAALLGITHNTASGYVKDIYRKLRVSSRAEAVLEATRRGIVAPGASY